MDQENNSVWKLLNDLSSKKGITEVSINKPNRVFVERAGKYIQLNVDLHREDIDNFILDVAQINNKECNFEEPILDGSLPDGSRVNIIIPPYSNDFPAISIRKYLKNINAFHSSNGAFDIYEKWISFFKAAVAAKVNIIVSGGTGSGKTTFLNLLLQEIPSDQRIITVEDTLELNFNLPNTVRLETSYNPNLKITIQDLVKNTLRMRPDRIIIGEVRGAEVFDLLQAMNTGHDGSMSTIHANSPAETLQRMETLFLLAGHDVPYQVVRRQIASGLNLIVQISRHKEGKRIISEIAEVNGMEGDTILTSTLAQYEDEGLKTTGIVPKIIDRLHYDGGLPRDFFT